MGLNNHATLTCDKDGVTTIELESVDGPLPDGWMKVEGYANTSGGDSDPFVGYFCPTSIQQFGIKELVKYTADISPALNQQAAPVK